MNQICFKVVGHYKGNENPEDRPSFHYDYPGNIFPSFIIHTPNFHTLLFHIMTSLRIFVIYYLGTLFRIVFCSYQIHDVQIVSPYSIFIALENRRFYVISSWCWYIDIFEQLLFHKIQSMMNSTWTQYQHICFSIKFSQFSSKQVVEPTDKYTCFVGHFPKRYDFEINYLWHFNHTEWMNVQQKKWIHHWNDDLTLVECSCEQNEEKKKTINETLRSNRHQSTANSLP